MGVAVEETAGGTTVATTGADITTADITTADIIMGGTTITAGIITIPVWVFMAQAASIQAGAGADMGAMAGGSATASVRAITGDMVLMEGTVTEGHIIRPIIDIPR